MLKNVFLCLFSFEYKIKKKIQTKLDHASKSTLTPIKLGQL